MKSTNPTRFIALILLVIVLAVAWFVFNGGIEHAFDTGNIKLPS
jgi:ammonia channel protein AmtB